MYISCEYICNFFGQFLVKSWLFYMSLYLLLYQVRQVHGRGYKLEKLCDLIFHINSNTVHSNSGSAQRSVCMYKRRSISLCSRGGLLMAVSLSVIKQHTQTQEDRLELHLILSFTVPQSWFGLRLRKSHTG